MQETTDPKGKPFYFNHQGGDFEYFSPAPESELCKEMRFSSDIATATFKKFSLLGYTNGDVRIILEYNVKFKKVNKFFKERGVDLYITIEEAYFRCYKTKTTKETKEVFNVICNEKLTFSDEKLEIFPKDKLELMQKFV